MTPEQYTARLGLITSSDIVDLTKRNKAGDDFGAPALAYIQQCIWERRIGRPIQKRESVGKAADWGNICERYVFNKYTDLNALFKGDTFTRHPDESLLWGGSPDYLIPGQLTGDIKCPWTIESFLTFADCDSIHDVREKHKDGEKYYWQLVSNSIINNTPECELLIFCPYKMELDTLRGEALALGYTWMNYHQDDNSLPYINEGLHYKNVVSFRFTPDQSDKDHLISLVAKASDKIREAVIKTRL